jgi:hypothetical protein
MADLLEEAIEAAVDVRGDLAGADASHAAIYVDAAIRSMRHARAWLIRRDARRWRPSVRSDGWWRMTFSDGMPTSVLLRADADTGLWIRGVEEEGAAVARTGAEVEWRQPQARDLGAELLSCPSARAMAAGPVGAALLMDALAHQTWFLPDDARRWASGVTGARAIVGALAEGAFVGAPAPGLSGLGVDRDALRIIEALGWRRDPAARWGVRRDDGSRALG